MCNLEYHFSFFRVNTVLICVFEQVLMDGKVSPFFSGDDPYHIAHST